MEMLNKYYQVIEVQNQQEKSNSKLEVSLKEKFQNKKKRKEDSTKRVVIYFKLLAIIHSQDSSLFKLYFRKHKNKSRLVEIINQSINMTTELKIHKLL
jgi:hypothetical protein